MYGRRLTEGTLGFTGVVVALGMKRHFPVVVAVVAVISATPVDSDWGPVLYRGGLEVDVTVVALTLLSCHATICRKGRGLEGSVRVERDVLWGVLQQPGYGCAGSEPFTEYSRLAKSLTDL